MLNYHVKQQNLWDASLSHADVNNLIHDIYPSHPLTLTSNNRRFLIVSLKPNVLTTSTIVLRHSQQFVINRTQVSSISIGLLRRLCAERKLFELSLFPEKNKKFISDLVKKHSLISDFTSLIILETLGQHIEYKIYPAKMRTKLYNDYLNYQKNKQETINTNRTYDAWNNIPDILVHFFL
ncbi:unnamed protein product [Didymodactylos carnosus]|uniref:Uncharacterized protein n=1 Tax=Didymodactylos carnosus TaxID=1234261 RepID=A0A815JTT6_9BILA|nr:unnamed protein product [Didymodactylos carnosus]CAF1383817.1 unnamed protein product [Didymodactylos carnosus]CAF4076227.1 unnamed protein product [Didymodactylos carnosus]CAF4278843.1 unnamed protein product [Didymodactylos carnosus]